jgi:GT2 family glycosyltransferase
LVGRRNTIVISRPERWQALKNWNSVIREQCSNPESVIFQLDGDDWLSCPTAIEEMMKQHRTADVVWSKYVATDGSPCCCSIIRTNDWRNSPWVTSHMRSFKKFLFDAIKPEDFLDWNGKIYELNYDQAIMLPILEMTITERLCFYDKELYVYNRDNPINDDKTHSPQDGWLTTCHIRSRKPYGRHPRYILPKPKPVSVVISSYNQLESLKLALESFYLQSEPPKEVIVADDGSTDGTLEWLDSIPEGKYPFPLHHVTRQHNGYRLASLQNLGAKKATGDRLLFTNADVVHCPTSISSHGRLADNLFGTGVVSSISEEGVKKVTIGHVLNHLLLKKLVEEYPAERNNLVWRKYGPMVHPSAVWGGNLSVSREIFNRIGGFDEGYDVGWGGEDTSLAKRCWERAGITLVWVDQSVVYHLGHPVKSYALEQKGTERFNATQG